MKRGRLLAIGLAALMLLPYAAAPAAEPDRIGYAYQAGTDELLYTEEHRQQRDDGRIARSTVDYLDPDGKLLARKRVDFNPGATSPDFRMENKVTGHVEGAERQDGQVRVFFRRSGDQELQEKTLKLPRRAIMDAGFDRFIERAWPRLLQGKEFERPFLVPSRMKFVNFRIYLERRSETDVTLIMEPASFLIRLLADGIVVTYDRGTAALKRYQGISNLRDDSGENYEVRVEFPETGSAPNHSD